MNPQKFCGSVKIKYLPFPFTMNKLRHAFHFVQIQCFVQLFFRMKECQNAAIYIPAVG